MSAGIFSTVEKMKTEKAFSLFLIFILTNTLILGGLGITSPPVSYLGFASGLVVGLLAYFFFNKVEIPRGFFLYLLFLLFLSLHPYLFKIKDAQTYQYFWLLSTGGILWYASFNLKSYLSEKFYLIIVAAGLVFGCLFYLGKILNTNFNSNSFGLFTSFEKTHNHIGDLWFLIIVMIVALWNRLKKTSSIFLLFFAVPIMLFSQSRSAYLALAAGLFYFLTASKNISKRNKESINKIVILTLLALFLVSGSNKSLLFSRPYFSYGVGGLISHPMGVGIGNFGKISSEEIVQMKNEKGMSDDETKGLFTSVTHNLLLEVFTGLGIIGGVFFMFWFIYLVTGIKWKSRSNLAYKAAFIGLTFNFMTDYTYVIPTMFWIWFILLGLIQASQKSK